MELKEFKEEDYSEICQWWTKRNFPCFPYELLPRTGFIAPGLAAGFFYDSNNSLMGIVEWTVTNPDADKKLRQDALDHVISHIIEHAKIRGKKFIITYSDNDKLIERYNKHGFITADKNMTHLGKVL